MGQVRWMLRQKFLAKLLSEGSFGCVQFLAVFLPVKICRTLSRVPRTINYPTQSALPFEEGQSGRFVAVFQTFTVLQIRNRVRLALNWPKTHRFQNEQ